MTAALLLAGAALIALALLFRRGGRERTLPTRPASVRATRFEQRDIVVAGCRLRYVDEGAGPPLLLVTGHTSRVEEYDRLIRALRTRFRVIVADMPGTGYSDKPARRYDLAFYEDALIGLLDALGVGRCAVAGGSLGGNLALRLAHRAPDRFVRAAAWGPGSAWPAKRLIAWCMRAFHLGGRPLFWFTVRIQSRFWYAPGWRGAAHALAATFAYYREVMCPGFIRMYWGIAGDQMGTSLFPIAGAIRRPVLLLWGDRDHGLGMGDGVKRLARLIPDCELVVVKDAGHSLAAERPDLLARALAAFLGAPDRPPARGGRTVH
jgi:pimeloyl-ACP methyl ester carboxylesterase